MHTLTGTLEMPSYKAAGPESLDDPVTIRTLPHLFVRYYIAVSWALQLGSFLMGLAVRTQGQGLGERYLGQEQGDPGWLSCTAPFAGSLREYPPAPAPG